MIDDPEKLARLTAWTEAQKAATYWKDEEMRLRKEIFEDAFPSPLEGVNRVDLPGGWKLKGTYKLTRKVDEAALPSILDRLREKNVSPDRLIKWKPELSTGEYKKLPGEVMAIVDEILEIKPATPSIEFEAPKEEPQA